MKTKLIEKQNKQVQTYFIGGLLQTGASMLGGFLGNKKANAQTNVNAATGVMANPNGTTTPAKPTWDWKSGVMGVAQGTLGLMTNQSSGLNKASKQMGNADTAVDMVASGVSMIPGVGTAIGTGLKLLNNFGGGLVKTPTAYKNFSTNQEVAQSSSLSGVAAKAGDAQSTIDSFKSSGLFGRLIGKRKKNTLMVDKAMQAQREGANVLNESKQAFEQATSSADMFSNRNTMKQYGDITGSIRIGKQGLKLIPKNQQGGQAMTPEQAQQAQEQAEKKEKQQADLTQAVGNKEANKGTVVDMGTSKPAVSRILPAKVKPINKNLAIQPRKRKPVSDIWEKFTGTPWANAKRDGLTNGSASSNKVIETSINSIVQPTKTLTERFLGNQMGTPSYKKGGSLNLDDIREARKAFQTFQRSQKLNLIIEAPDTELTIKSFRDGGVLSAPQNVIVDGVLHAHKHNIDKLEGFGDAEITLKGMPVVTLSEGGEIEQHAEVEKDEVILHLSLTEKLEELMKDGSEEAKIEAGKLLTEELLSNTKDSDSKLLK